MFSKLYNAFQLIRKGHFVVFLKELQNRIYSNSVSFGLQRDLKNEFHASSAKITIQIRTLRTEELPELLDTSSDPTISPRIVAGQRAMVKANIPICYVAVTVEDKPCYMQWLIGYDDNQKIKDYFKGVFPPLKKQEALLEGAYSHPAYRGLRIMPNAMALIAEKAANINARWVNTFVDVTNIPSLKGCQRSGFEPYLIRKDRWFLFRRSITFHPLSEAMMNMFYSVTDSERFKIGNNQNTSLPKQNEMMVNTLETKISE